MDDAAFELADRASGFLTSAGRRRFAAATHRRRSTFSSAPRSLPRSDEPAWLELGSRPGLPLFQAGEFERAEAVLSDAIEHANNVSERQNREARVARASIKCAGSTTRSRSTSRTRSAGGRVTCHLSGGRQRHRIGTGICRVWDLYQWQGEPAAQQEAAERGRVHARRAGSRLDEARCLAQLGRPLTVGPKPAADVIETLRDLRDKLGADLLGRAIDAMPTCSCRRDARPARRRPQAQLVESRTAIEEFGIVVHVRTWSRGCGCNESLPAIPSLPSGSLARP